MEKNNNTAGEQAKLPISTAEQHLRIINLQELEAKAGQTLDKGAFGYVQSGAEDEVTLKDNTLAFDKTRIVPHGLAGIQTVDMKTSLLGIDLPSPVIITPMAAHGLMHQDAEKATVKGAAKAGTILSLSTYASTTIADVAASSPVTPLFFMLYMSVDNGFNEYLLGQAKAAGVKAIILGIDAGVPGSRETDKRNNYSYGVPTPNVSGYYEGKSVTQSEARASRKISFTSADIELVKKVSGLPVLVKGVMLPADAETAIAAGADGIWVSNHGGRQLDNAPASIEMLPMIAKTVAKRVPIIFDSGIRRGSHIFKALASGADIVAVGRPVLYGLHLGGSEGVKDVLGTLNRELETVMTLAGTENVAAIKKTELFDVK